MMGGPYCNCPEWGGQTLHNEGCSLGRSASTRTLTITSCNHNAEIARYREALERIAAGSTDIQSRKAARIALEEKSATARCGVHTFVTPDVCGCGHDNRDREDEAWFMEKEIDRLRRIEEAARALMAPHSLTVYNPPMGEAAAGWVWPEWDALRAELEEKP